MFDQMSRGGASMPGQGGGGFGAPQGGQQTAPGMFGGPIVPNNPFGNAQNSAQGLQQSQNALWKMKEQCAQGDGQACITAQRMEQQFQQQQQQHQNMLQQQSMTGAAGSMGQNGRGGRNRVDPMGMSGPLLQSMFGASGGGGAPGGW